MENGDEYRFVIDGYSPETMPMLRLADYMRGLARLLGRAEQVHFVRLDPGSTVLVHRVDAGAEPEVQGRICALAAGKAPKDVRKAHQALNRRLADDGAVGSLEAPGGMVIPFPGQRRQAAPAFGSFRQAGVLDGVLIRIGGRGAAVPVHLQAGNAVHQCSASRDTAKRLAAHLYGPTLRVQGEGRWQRSGDGQWSLTRFTIMDFRKLDDAPLGETVERLRGVEGSGWKEIADPWSELRRLRGQGGRH